MCYPLGPPMGLIEVRSCGAGVWSVGGDFAALEPSPTGRSLWVSEGTSGYAVSWPDGVGDPGPRVDLGVPTPSVAWLDDEALGVFRALTHDAEAVRLDALSGERLQRGLFAMPSVERPRVCVAGGHWWLYDRLARSGTWSEEAPAVWRGACDDVSVGARVPARTWARSLRWTPEALELAPSPDGSLCAMQLTLRTRGAAPSSAAAVLDAHTGRAQELPSFPAAGFVGLVWVGPQTLLAPTTEKGFALWIGGPGRAPVRVPVPAGTARGGRRFLGYAGVDRSLRYALLLRGTRGEGARTPRGMLRYDLGAARWDLVWESEGGMEYGAGAVGHWWGERWVVLEVRPRRLPSGRYPLRAVVGAVGGLAAVWERDLGELDPEDGPAKLHLSGAGPLLLAEVVQTRGRRTRYARWLFDERSFRPE